MHSLRVNFFQAEEGGQTVKGHPGLEEPKPQVTRAGTTEKELRLRVSGASRW